MTWSSGAASPRRTSLYQDSDNTSKAPFIRGHHFGFVGLRVGSLTKAFCLPLRGQLHEGIEGLREERGWQDQPATIVTRMAHLVVWSAQQMNALCYVALDAYFATGPAFGIFKAASMRQDNPGSTSLPGPKTTPSSILTGVRTTPSSKIRTNYP